MVIDGATVISGVQLDLFCRREAPHRSASDLASNENSGGIAEPSVTGTVLPATASVIVEHRMEIDVPVIVGIAEFDANGQPVSRHHEAGLTERVDRRRNECVVDQNVEISVRAGLDPKKRINTPSTTNDRMSSQHDDQIEHPDRVSGRGRHWPSLVAATIRTTHPGWEPGNPAAVYVKAPTPDSKRL